MGKVDDNENSVFKHLKRHQKPVVYIYRTDSQSVAFRLVFLIKLIV